MSFARFLFAAILFAFAVSVRGEEGVSAPAQSSAPESQSLFFTLPFCKFCEGVAEVQKPGAEWTPVEEGKFYPLGSAFRTRGVGKMTVAFGKGATAAIAGDASFSTKAQAISVKSRTVILGEGSISLVLPDGTPEGMFFVSAPGFLARNLAGSSRFVNTKTAAGERTVIHCQTGSFGVSGRHFEIPQMRAANILVLTDEHDHLVTVIENTSGDYVIRLDQGVRAVADVAPDGSQVEKSVEEKAELKLSPKMKVNITRAVPAIGERMSVFVIAFDAAGNPLGSGVSFCEGRAEVNSGVLVKPAVSSDSDALAKAAAEASEAEDVAAAADEVEDDSASEDASGEATEGSEE